MWSNQLFPPKKATGEYKKKMADLHFLNPEDCVLDFQRLDYGLNHFESICKINGESRGGAQGGGGRWATSPFFGGDRPPPPSLSKGQDDWLPPPLIPMSGSSTENDADYGFLNRFTFP